MFGVRCTAGGEMDYCHAKPLYLYFYFILLFFFFFCLCLFFFFKQKTAYEILA